ncbi:MAG: precorrin-3B C(17)-methyltransferase [Anaerovoracaceae bacterium]|nr:precorrin-3B C(17)-methyltransferase [Bacillota bacterium]MDY2670863.1 precorrin-3B C(17)-methyltransferase [Anaerovoracaceae bacterium]
MKLSIVGIGPGSAGGMTLEARERLSESELIVGYGLYVDLVKDLFPEKEYYTSGMRKETERVRFAVEKAAAGTRTALVCSGDSGVYGMASLAFETAEALGLEAGDIEVIPGVTAALSCGALLGSPLSCDFAVISLSDLLVPWERIEKRLACVAESDMPLVLYNPSSKKRRDHLKKACRIMMGSRSPRTVCGIVRNAGREGQSAELMSLEELADYEADMLTTVIIGGSSTRNICGRMVTPRGYSGKYDIAGKGGQNGSGEEENEKTDRISRGGGPLLIFGGTSEGRELALRAERAGYETWLSTATEYGRETAQAHLKGVKILAGKLPEDEIESLIRNRGFSCVIDATHPYAGHISGSLEQAAENTGIKLVRVRRKIQTGPTDEEVMFFSTMDEIIDFLNGTEGGVFFSTGSNAAESYSRLIDMEERGCVRILPSAEALEKVKKAGFSSRNIMCMQGPFSEEMNEACFSFFNVRWLVTKSSGRAGGFDEKISAARRLGIKVLVLAPPQETEGIAMEEALKMIGEGRL